MDTCHFHACLYRRSFYRIFNALICMTHMRYLNITLQISSSIVNLSTHKSQKWESSAKNEQVKNPGHTSEVCYGTNSNVNKTKCSKTTKTTTFRNCLLAILRKNTLLRPHNVRTSLWYSIVGLTSHSAHCMSGENLPSH